jgi:nucleoside-diphosphate-sugar epimerase
MQIIITGGGGFLGQRLAKALLRAALPFDELVLADLVMPANPVGDTRVTCRQIDLSAAGAARALITPATDIVFHLAAVVSSHAEKDFDLGWRVNLDTTRQLLEACRHTKEGIRFVFSSSLAVYGGDLPPVVNDQTVVTPQSSYGIQKAMSELMVNDYTRKGFADGIALRLPTICVRPGRPNLAASSFVSSIIREPLRGEDAICPVSPELPLFLSSPDTVIRNLIHASTVKAEALKGWRTLNLPGISVTVKQMLESLRHVTDEEVLARVKFKPDESINRIVSSWPGHIDNAPALRLGFFVDDHFDKFIHQHLTETNTSRD